MTIGKSTAGRRLLAAGNGMSTAGSRLLDDGSSCFKYVSVSHTATSADRLLLTHQTTTPWKTSGAGVAARKGRTGDR